MWMTRLALLAIVAAFAVSSMGCNTVRGAGKDIERGGEKVQEVADDAKN